MAMVCLCRGVSERRVQRAIDAGAGSVTDVALRCGAGSVCCGCHPTIEGMLESAATPVSVTRPAFA